MYNELIRQWTKSAKEITEFNISTMSTMAETLESFWGTENLAKTTKTILDSGFALRKAGDSALNKSVKSRIDAMKLNPTGSAVQNFTLINSETLTDLMESQVAMMNFWGNFTKEYLGALARSRTVTDLYTVPMTLLPDLPKEVAEKSMAPVGVMNSYLSSMETWSSETVDTLAENTPPAKKKKA